MARFQLEVGVRFVRDHKDLIVVDIQHRTHIVLEEIISRTRLVMDRQVVESEFLSGKLRLLLAPDNPDQRKAKPFDRLTIAQKTAVRRKLHYVLELQKASSVQSANACIETVIKQASEKICDPLPPGKSTVFKWRRKWLKANRTPSALISRLEDRGRRSFKIKKEVQDLLLAEISKHYLKREAPTLQFVYDAYILPRIRRENESRASNEQLTPPSRATVFRFVQSMDPFDKMAAREGISTAENYFRNSGAGLVATAPMDIVQIDHTVLDIQLISPIEGFIARPTLTVALDLYSRMPVGIYLGFASPGYESVMHCLKNAILPKDQCLSHFGSIKGRWPCFGLPRKVLLDNGLEFHSESLRDACSLLGISIIHHPVRTPHYKGAVERFFGTVNTGLLAGLPGRTFSNVSEKGDYDPVQHAAIPFQAFYEAFFKWIIDVYAVKPHRGINDLPLQRWNQGVKRFPVDLPERPENLRTLLGQPLRPTLQRSGLHWFNSRYNSPQLGELFKRIGGASKVDAKVDPTDIGTIYVYDEYARDYIPVPCLEPEMRGLTIWQYKQIRRMITAKLKVGYSQFSVGEAKADIAQILNHPSLNKRRKVNKSSARYAENLPVKKISVELDDAWNEELELDEENRAAFNEYLKKAQNDGWLQSDGEGE